MSKSNQISNANQPILSKRFIWGKRLVLFSGAVLAVSAGVKFLHPPKAVAYMGSMGYEGSTFYLIALLELATATVFLLPATRRFGLLLLSSYYGGAIAAHLAVHRFFTGGPFLVYMAHHPYVGAMIPGGLLLLAWLGTYLCGSELWTMDADLRVATAEGTGSQMSGSDLALRLASGE